MKKIVLALFTLTLLHSHIAAAEDNAKDTAQLFRKANAYYERMDYAKALECYTDLLDSGIESGNLYYNIGNGFLKLGKIGYAMLSYEKAKKIMPGDSDLKSNIEYAKLLVDSPSYDISGRRLLARIIERPFRDVGIAIVLAITLVFYAIVVILLARSALNRLFASKARFFTIVFLCIFAYCLTAFSLRYYREEILRFGIVIQKECECKYEPIDKSTTYYTLGEGSKVRILKTLSDWRQIKRIDGKISWIKKEAVEMI